MKGTLLVRRLTFSAGVVVTFLLFCYLLFPTGKIDSLIAQSLSQQGLTLAPPVHKTLLPGLAWDKMTLSSERGPLLSCQRFQIRLQLLPLLIGRVKFIAGATIGNGYLDASYAVNGKAALSLDSNGIALSDIPLIKSVLGANAAGNLWIHGELQRGTNGLNGDIKLEVKQFGFSGARIGAFALPEVANLKTQGMLKVANNKARLESFTMEGDGIFMRISGDLPPGSNIGSAPISLMLEIMPKPEFLEKQKLVFMLLTKFMISPGVYKVPISGSLLKPVIM